MFKVGDRVRIIESEFGFKYINKTGTIHRTRDWREYKNCVTIRMDDDSLNDNRTNIDSGWWWNPSSLTIANVNKRIKVREHV